MSFPDITLLPKLATYFNVSIDELIGYEPQLTREQIKELYCQLKNIFANEKFIYGAVRQGGRARDFEEAIEWLVSAGMLNRIYNVSKMEHPVSHS